MIRPFLIIFFLLNTFFLISCPTTFLRDNYDLIIFWNAQKIFLYTIKRTRINFFLSKHSLSNIHHCYVYTFKYKCSIFIARKNMMWFSGIFLYKNNFLTSNWICQKFIITTTILTLNSFIIALVYLLNNWMKFYCSL